MRLFSTAVALWINSGREEMEFDFVLSHCKVDAIYLLGDHSPTNKILRHAQRVATAAQLPHENLVLMSPRNSRHFEPTQSLQDFQHPASAVYLFGPNNQHLSPEDMGGRKPDHTVYIPTDTNDEMFNYTACLVTLMHRAGRV